MGHELAVKLLVDSVDRISSATITSPTVLEEK